jgi:hypothetical protein
VVGVRVGLEERPQVELFAAHVGGDAVDRLGGEQAAAGLVVEDRVDDEGVAGGRVVDDVGEGRGPGVEERLDVHGIS